MTELDSTLPRPSAFKTKGGMEGVVAVPSAICFIDGTEGRLVLRGYEIGDLVEHTTFEEVAWLLWHTDLPNRAQLAALKSDLSKSAALPPHVHTLFRALPKQTNPMDALRTAVSSLGTTDPYLEKHDPASDLRKAIHLTAQIPTIISAFHRYSQGLDAVAPDPTLSIAANFLYMLNGKKAHDTLSRVLDAALVLHAEHGMNASTFTARVAAATMCDMHGAVTAATAALKGPLHGGANEDVMQLLIECGDVEHAAKKVRQMLAEGKKVPGFGHRVYKTIDPRAAFLRKISKKLGEDAGNTKWYDISETLIPIMKEAKNAEGKPRNLNPNVDFFSASAYYTMGIPIHLFTPIFAMARVAGWSAHIMEQHQNNRIIRPTDDYSGPMGRTVKPIEQRA
jgi:citrate synthase